MLRKHREAHNIFGANKQKTKKLGKTIVFKVKCINNVRFMLTSVSSLADNLAGGHHRGKCMQQSDLAYMAVDNNSLIFNV